MINTSTIATIISLAIGQLVLFYYFYKLIYRVDAHDRDIMCHANQLAQMNNNLHLEEIKELEVEIRLRELEAALAVRGAKKKT